MYTASQWLVIKMYGYMMTNEIGNNEMARACGLSKAYLSQLLKGKNANVSLEIAIKICKVIHCKLDSLVKLVEESN